MITLWIDVFMYSLSLIGRGSCCFRPPPPGATLERLQPRGRCAQLCGGLRNHTGFPSPLCNPPLPRYPDPGLAQRRGLWPRRSGITCHPSTGPETVCRRPGPSTGAWRQPATAGRPTTHGCWRHPARPWPGCCDSTPGETPSWEGPHGERCALKLRPREGGENHRTCAKV